MYFRVAFRFLPAALGAVMSAAMLLPQQSFAANKLLARGRYLMHSIVACGGCHTPQAGPLAGKELAGGMPIKDPAFVAYPANITPDKATGIGDWTDAQIIRAIRNGIRPDGSLIGPPMPIDLYRKMSDYDVKAIVAYLHTVKPVHNKVPASVYHIPLPKSYGPPVHHVPRVSRKDPVRYGQYLATIGHCIECHTPLVKGRRDFAHQLGAGGSKFEGPWGESVAPNITPTGLRGWTDAQIKTAITQGVTPDGTKLKPPMPFGYFKNLKKTDLNDIVAYLRSLPPKP